MDPVTLGVVLNATSEVMREMRIKMMRTGFSSIVRESSDVYFGILDTAGDLVSEVEAGAVASGVIRSQTQEIIRRFGSALEPGDTYIVNHPYQACQSHTCDVVVVSPVYAGDRLVAFVTNYGHKPDMGGKVAGTQAGDATDIFQEGLLIPPIPLYKAGVLRPSIRALIEANTRTPEVTWGDIEAQAVTNAFGAERILALMGRFGIDAVQDAWRQWAEIGEQEMRRRVAAIPDGTYGPARDHIDDDGVDVGRPLRLEVVLTVEGDRLRFTFDSSPQARGPLNLRPCVIRSVTEFFVLSALAPDLAGNPGIGRCVEIELPPEGHVLNPRFPAAINMYSTVRARLGAPLTLVLGQAVPDRVPAPGSGANHSVSMNGIDPRDGRWFSYYEILWGGYGARPDRDGIAGLCDGAEVLNTPVEAIETEFPLRVSRFALVPDSGGAGRWRGGLGSMREWEVLADELSFNLRSDHHQFPSQGAFGGQGGTPSAGHIRAAGGAWQRVHSKLSGVRLHRGDCLRTTFCGGGGWGDPHAREPERVREDVLDGYVSVAAAREAYGVALDPLTLALDPAETARLRTAEDR